MLDNELLLLALTGPSHLIRCNLWIMQSCLECCFHCDSQCYQVDNQDDLLSVGRHCLFTGDEGSLAMEALPRALLKPSLRENISIPAMTLENKSLEKIPWLLLE